MSQNQRSRTRELLKANERIWAGLAILVTIILGYVYHQVWWYWIPDTAKNQATREFVLAIITNIIPVPLLFAFSYLVFRRIQEIKSDEEKDEVAEVVVNSIQTSLSKNFYALLMKPDLAEIKTQVETLSKVARFSQGSEELEVLKRLRNSLMDLEETVSKRIQVLSDTVRKEFLDMEDNFQQLEKDLRKAVIAAVRETIIRELEFLKIGLDSRQISEFSEKFVATIEQSLNETEEKRTAQIQKEIRAGMMAIQNKVNETIVQVQDKEEHLSEDIGQQIETRQDVESFVTEIRGERKELLKSIWKNIQDEFEGELEKNSQTPKDMVREFLRKNKIGEQRAADLSEQLVTIFVHYLASALDKMQTERLSNLTQEKPNEEQNAPS
jgi:hypothetical protein